MTTDAALLDSISIASMGMRAQGARIRVISENMANADTASTTSGEMPYQRKNISFKNVLDNELGVNVVKVDDITSESGNFVTKYMPGHPGADDMGYVKMPDINMLIEIMDMKEAQRSYEANLGMIEQSRSMLSRTIDLLKTA